MGIAGGPWRLETRATPSVSFSIRPVDSILAGRRFRFEKSTLFLEGSAGRRVDSWWQETPAFRAYWDVKLSAGGLYRIFRDEPGGEWFADGVYD
jgi:hypothetical protein